MELNSACQNCPARLTRLQQLGIEQGDFDFVIALAGNPNTGKSTVFNRLTGLRQHTGNWPGKTITRAEGAFAYNNRKYKIIDLPGTYSLLSISPDEEVARDFILFGKPDVTVIIVDATCLERNLNLVLQILELTNKAVLCVNLIDEAEAHGIKIDTRMLARELGIPVVPCAAREGRGINELLEQIEFVATGKIKCNPYKLKLDIPGLSEAMQEIKAQLEKIYPDLPNIEWVVFRLLDGDRQMIENIRSGKLRVLYGDNIEQNEAILNEIEKENNFDKFKKNAESTSGEIVGELTSSENKPIQELIENVALQRWRLPHNFHDRITETIYTESERICSKVIFRDDSNQRLAWQQRLDRLLTNPSTAFPLMILLFGIVLWFTISGANYPSELLSSFLVDFGHTKLRSLATAANLPHWITGALVDGAYLATAWVVSVMLPPMAIFFPIFTMLEDFGYLPRVAFNLDGIFQKVGAHGKQALTMTMGLGCNAAGVVATRIIDSPRERLIAIVTNNFSLCNGRWPLQILIASVFIGSLVPSELFGVVSTAVVMAVALTGFALTFLVSWFLSRTILKGEATSFSLELPPYRPPNIIRTIYTSLIDRTIFVLWRAIVFAFPAGIFIWLVSNISINEHSIAWWIIKFFDPIAWIMGLTGAVLLAYIVAIPANEIVLPATLMLTALVSQSTPEIQSGVLVEATESGVKSILIGSGWNTLNAICLLLFSLCHNPCSTTLYTIYKETKSVKWTILSALIPLAIGFCLCSLIAIIWRTVM